MMIKPLIMPIYMDLHVVPGIEAKHAAEAHREDLQIQDEYGCRCMTYWVDEEKGSAFCLIDAPNIEAVMAMHDAAHGLIPHEIIEVNSNVVEAFLGRIHDPEGHQDLTDPTLKVFNDPAFRTIVLVCTDDPVIVAQNIGGQKMRQLFNLYREIVREQIHKFEGREVESNQQGFIVSFVSVHQAMRCVHQIQKYLHVAGEMIGLAIGIDAGVPVNGHKQMFGKTIESVKYLCLSAIPGQIVGSPIIKELWIPDAQFSFGKERLVFGNVEEHKFLVQLAQVIEENCKDPNFGIPECTELMNTSKSGLYRSCMQVFDQSPNAMIRDRRLSLALRLLRKGVAISECAYEAGFNSPSYFAKCFQEAFDLTPSDYVNQSKEID